MALSTEQQMLIEQRLSNEKKSTGVAYLLWFFLGGLGIHRFYLGKSGSAFAMLALSILGWATLVLYVGVFLLIILGIWLIVDAFLIPGMIQEDTDAKRASLRSQISMA